MPESDRLLEELAGAVLDGTAVDWPAAEASAGPDGRSRIRDLRLLASVAGVHRGAQAQQVLPDRWGHLRLFQPVGRGSSGEVIRAWDAELDREVALKLLPASTTSAVREGRLLARVQHPNVVTIHGAAQIGDRVGLWMEFIHGRTLEQVLQENGRFPQADVASVGIDVCRAVAAVHEAGLLHRDIKAHNVMRADDGRIVLMDFGAGRERSDAKTGNVTGTPLYLAPELLQKGPPSVQSDIYSIGVLLYHLASGAYPVCGESVAALSAAHDRGERTPLRVAAQGTGAGLARLIERAIDPQPERRFPTAAALGAALEQLKRRERRKPWFYRAALVVALAGVGIAMWARRSEPSSQTPIGIKLPAALPSAGSSQPRVRGTRRSVEVEPFTSATRQPDHGWLSATLAELIRREIRPTEFFRWLPDDVSAAKRELGEALWNGPSSRLHGDLFELPDFRFVPPRTTPDFRVAGDYRISGSPQELTVTVTVTGGAIDGQRHAITETGQLLHVIELVSRLGARVRDALAAPTLTADQERALVNSRPANGPAARAYVEGLEKSPRDAVELMQEAVRADPRFAPAYAVLAEGWLLRHDVDRAREESARAEALSEGLPVEERYLIRARLASIPEFGRSGGSVAGTLSTATRGLKSLFPDTRLYAYALALHGSSSGSVAQQGSGRGSESTTVSDAVDDADVLLLQVARLQRAGNFPGAQRALDQVAGVAQARRDRGLLGRVRYEEARIARRTDDPIRALSLAEDALQIFVDGQYRPQALVARSAMAPILAAQKTAAAVKPAYEQLIAKATERQDFAREIALRRSLAHAMLEQGRLAEARNGWESLERRGQAEPRDGLVASLELGRVAYRRGELAVARRKVEAALTAAVGRKDHHEEVSARALMAQILIDTGDVAGARDQADKSVALARRLDEPAWQSLVPALSIAAMVRLEQWEPAEGKQMLAEVTSMGGMPVRGYCPAEFQMAMPVLKLETEPVDNALAAANSTVRCAREALRPDLKAEADLMVTRAWLRARKTDDAVRAFAPVADRLNETEDRLLRLSAGIVAAQLGAAAKAAHPTTARNLTQLIREATDLGAVAIAFRAALALGQIEVREGFLESGRARLATLERDAIAKGFIKVARQAAEARR